MAQRTDRERLPIAAIPLVFAVQQFFEGLVWLGVRWSAPELAVVAAIAYLFFALLFWPVWIPYSVLRVSPPGPARVFLRAMTVLGVVLGLGLMLPIVLDPRWLAVNVTHHSLHYNIGESPIFDSFPALVWEVAYLAVVSAPLVVASDRMLIHGGVAVILSAAVTHVFFDHAFASVWCFFAAVLSLYVCWGFVAVGASRSRAIA